MFDIGSAGETQLTGADKPGAGDGHISGSRLPSDHGVGPVADQTEPIVIDEGRCCAAGRQVDRGADLLAIERPVDIARIEGDKVELAIHFVADLVLLDDDIAGQAVEARGRAAKVQNKGIRVSGLQGIETVKVSRVEPIITAKSGLTSGEPGGEPAVELLFELAE